jgi:protocatechuate 3,4-dioxygenase beta subunit
MPAGSRRASEDDAARYDRGMTRPPAFLGFTVWLILGTPAAAAADQPPQRQERHARIEGRVLDGHDLPVAGATIEVRTAGRTLARTWSDALGVFVVGNLPPHLLTVHAHTAAPSVGATSVDLVQGGGEFANLQMVPARVVQGHVRDDAGQPIAGAWILASPKAYGPLAQATCSVQSAADGSYRLPHVAVGGCHLRAWGPGCDAAATTVDGTAPSTVDFVLARGEGIALVAELEGADAATLASAECTVFAYAGDLPVPLPPPLARPVRQGARWLVPGWIDGDAIAVALTTAHGPSWPQEAWRNGGTGSHRFLFRTTGAGLLHGRIDGNRGRRLPLLLQPVGVGIVRESQRVRVVTNRDGTFVAVNPAAGARQIAVRSLTSEQVLASDDEGSAWACRPAAQADEWRIAASPGHQVRLRVVDERNLPVAGARVELYAATPQWLAHTGSGHSNLDGQVRIEALTTANVVAWQAHVTSVAGWATVRVEPEVGDTTDVGDVPLAAGATVTGTLHDANAAQPFGMVALHQRIGRDAPFVRLVVADHQGRFTLRGLWPGTFHTLDEVGNRLDTLPQPTGAVTVRWQGSR